jgi:hypothetical protein
MLRLLWLALLASAALAVQGAPANAATSGPLSVQLEGSLGAPVLEQPPLTIWPFSAVETMRGLVESTGDTDGTLVIFVTGDPDRPYVIGSVWDGEVDIGGRAATVTFTCAVTDIGLLGEPLGGPCAVTGAVRGSGTFQVSRLELRGDGSIAWELTFPSVFCHACPAR